MRESSRSKKSKSKKAKAKYLDNRHLALSIMGPDGFDKVKAEIGDRLDPKRASKLVKLLKEEYDFKEKALPKELLELASKKRTSHTGGVVTSPTVGETRYYKTGKNGRIGSPLNTIGKKEGDIARVVFGSEKISIFRK